MVVVVVVWYHFFKKQRAAGAGKLFSSDGGACGRAKDPPGLARENREYCTSVLVTDGRPFECAMERDREPDG